MVTNWVSRLISHGASVAGALRLGGSHKSAVWRGMNGESCALALHIGNPMDAWPVQEHLHLDGFTFNHLRGFEETL